MTFWTVVSGIIIWIVLMLAVVRFLGNVSDDDDDDEDGSF